jgi:putative aldouronate transport system permease protein
MLNLDKIKVKPDEAFFYRLKKDIKKNSVLYLIVLLPVVYYVLFSYLPMYGLVISFKNYSPALGIENSPWVGWKHFKDFFNNIYFWRLIGNTLTISVSSLVFGFPAPIFLALLINELSNKHFVKIVQTVTYLPHFISLVVLCGMITSFTGTNGLITGAIAHFTGDTTSILMKPECFTPVYVITNIWQEVGWGSIIYLAALTNIDSSLYEACKIDGGGRLRQTIHITIPGILPTIIILFIMRMGSLLSVGYEKIILLYNPTTYKTADVISTYVYRKGLLESNYSYASAVGLINSVVSIILLIIANKISSRLSDVSLW